MRTLALQWLNIVSSITLHRAAGSISLSGRETRFTTADDALCVVGGERKGDGSAFGQR